MLAVLALAIIIWVTSFEWIERIFGYGGLCMLVFAVAAVKLDPTGAASASGFVPHVPHEQQAALRVLRDRSAWRGDDALRGLFLLVGRSRGSVVAEGPRPQPRERDHRLRPRRFPLTRTDDRRRAHSSSARASRPSTSARSHSASGSRSGQIGLLLALVGILFAVGGASIDTVFSGAYNLAQFCGWEWGRYRHARGAPRFTLTWLVLLVLRRC